MNRKICQRNPLKRNKKVHLNILGTENSSIEPDEIMVKFTHCKIGTNSNVSFNLFYVIFSYSLMSTKSAKNVQNFIFYPNLEKLF